MREVLPTNGHFSRQKGQKYIGNGHNFSINFVFAITFKPIQMFDDILTPYDAKFKSGRNRGA